MVRRPGYGLAIAAVVASALLASPGAAFASTGGRGGAAGKTSFSAFPSRVLQGRSLTVTVATRPAGVTCALSVRYADGTSQAGLPAAYAAGGRATWTWVVPEVAMAGPARVTASCGRAGRAVRSFIVVGSLVPPRVDVEKQGFSVRTRTYGGSAVSYGLLLRNVSPNADALNVSVLVNFVMANDRLVGTEQRTIPVLPAGTKYAYGGSMSFPAAAPIERLEVVIQIGGRQKRSVQQPALAAVRVVPSLFEPAWVGEVDGEVINDHSTLTLRGTQLSAVVFDAAGNIIGGTNGSAFATLPPGTRQVFKLTLGVDAIPAFTAATAHVTALGTYGPTGT